MDIMSDKQGNSEKISLFKRILFLFIKQTVAALICLCIALGLKFSNNNILNTCANALRLAINHNLNWEETVKEAFFNLSPDSLDNEIK